MRTVFIAKGISVGRHPQGLVSEAYTHGSCAEMHRFNKEGNGGFFPLQFGICGVTEELFDSSSRCVYTCLYSLG